MNLLEFIGKYPKILNHPQIKIEDDFSVFRHELCHFIEREMDKAFLVNFGFSTPFGATVDFSNKKEFESFYKREVRVMALERVCPFLPEDFGAVHFSRDTYNFIRNNKLEKEYLAYKEIQEQFYTRKVWWELFNKKYTILAKQNKELCYS